MIRLGFLYNSVVFSFRECLRVVNVEAHAAQGSHCRISDVKHYYVCFCFVLFCFVLFVFRFVCFLLVMFCFCFSFFVFFLSHSLSSPFYSLPPSRNSDPGSHSRLFFPHPPRYGSCLAFFIAIRFQLFLPSSTRVELCLPTLGALSS